MELFLLPQGLDSNCKAFCFFFVAMQFGQLLTHLDTTQQMIASSLKDNTTLLTQVRVSLANVCLFRAHLSEAA